MNFKKRGMLLYIIYKENEDKEVPMKIYLCEKCGGAFPYGSIPGSTGVCGGTGTVWRRSLVFSCYQGDRK